MLMSMSQMGLRNSQIRLSGNSAGTQVVEFEGVPWCSISDGNGCTAQMWLIQTLPVTGGKEGIDAEAATGTLF